MISLMMLLSAVMLIYVSFYQIQIARQREYEQLKQYYEAEILLDYSLNQLDLCLQEKPLEKELRLPKTLYFTEGRVDFQLEENQVIVRVQTKQGIEKEETIYLEKDKKL